MVDAKPKSLHSLDFLLVHVKGYPGMCRGPLLGSSLLPLASLALASEVGHHFDKHSVPGGNLFGEVLVLIKNWVIYTLPDSTTVGTFNASLLFSSGPPAPCLLYGLPVVLHVPDQRLVLACGHPRPRGVLCQPEDLEDDLESFPTFWGMEH